MILQENVFFPTKNLGWIKISSLKLTFLNEILNIITNMNFLQTFLDEFHIFITKNGVEKFSNYYYYYLFIYLFIYGANTFVMKIDFLPMKFLYH